MPTKKLVFYILLFQGLVEPKYGPGRCTSENALLALQSKFGYSFKSACSGSGMSGVIHSRSENVLADRLADDHPEADPLLTPDNSSDEPKTSPETRPGRSPRMERFSHARSPTVIENVLHERTLTIEEDPSESDKFLK